MSFLEIISTEENIICNLEIKYLHYKNANAIPIIQNCLDRFIFKYMNNQKNKEDIIDIKMKSVVKDKIKYETFIFQFLYDIYEFKISIKESIENNEVNYKIIATIECINKSFREKHYFFYNNLINLIQCIKIDIRKDVEL